MKKFLTTILSILLVVIMSTSLIACNREDDNGKDDNKQQSSVEEPKAPELVNREVFTLALESNVMGITLNQLESAVTTETGLLDLREIVFRDILLGDIAQLLIGETVSFGYYDDGNWYLSNGAKFTPVPNAIFNYKLSEGGALALSEAQLALYGKNTVLSCFTELFAINASQVIPQLPGDLGAILNVFMNITVQELYDLTAGNPQFFVDFLNETRASTLVGALLEGASYAVSPEYGEYGELFAAVNNMTDALLVGSIANPSFNANVLVSDLIDSTHEILNCFISLAVIDEIFVQAANLYANTTVADFAAATKDLLVDDVISSLANVVIAAAPVNADLVYAVKDLLQLTLLGTLAAPAVEENVKAREFIYGLANVASAIGVSEEFYAEIVRLASACGEEYLYECSIEIHTVIDMLGLDEQTTELLKNLASGTVSEPEIDATVYITDIVDALVGESTGANENAILCALADEIKAIYEGIQVGEFTEASKHISVDDIISSMAKVAVVAAPELEGAVYDVAELLNMLLDGILAAPELVMNVEIPELVAQLMAIAENVVAIPEYVYDAVEAVTDLYHGVFIDEVVEATMCLEMDKMVSAGVNVFMALVKDQTSIQMLMEMENLAHLLIDGTLAAPEFNSEVLVAEVLGIYAEIMELSGASAEEIAAIEEVIYQYGDMYFIEYVEMMAQALEMSYEQFMQENGNMTIGELIEMMGGFEGGSDVEYLG